MRFVEKIKVASPRVATKHVHENTSCILADHTACRTLLIPVGFCRRANRASGPRSTITCGRRRLQRRTTRSHPRPDETALCKFLGFSLCLAVFAYITTSQRCRTAESWPPCMLWCSRSRRNIRHIWRRDARPHWPGPLPTARTRTVGHRPRSPGGGAVRVSITLSFLRSYKDECFPSLPCRVLRFPREHRLPTHDAVDVALANQPKPVRLPQDTRHLARPRTIPERGRRSPWRLSSMRSIV